MIYYMESLGEMENHKILSETPIYVYYKFRLTLDEDVWDASDGLVGGQPLGRRTVISMDALREWTEYLCNAGYVAGRMTAGWEVKNSFGDFCKPHIHIHFKSTSKHDTVRKGIQRHYKALWDEELRGNDMYSCKLCAFPESEEKFFRYTLKQKHIKIKGKHFCRGFADDDIARMAAEAHGSWVSSAEVKNAKKEKLTQADTLYDRLLNYCKKKLDGKPLHISLLVQFYRDEKRPLNDATMVGYYHLIRLDLDEITIAEYSAKIISKYSL